MNLIADNSERLACIFREDFSSLVLLPKIEKLINKQEPTLEDVLGLCSDNQSLLEKLTRRGGFGGGGDEFAKEILFKKGLSFLKSLAIRTMNQEIFELPLKLSGMSEVILKKRAVILARFIKYYNEFLGLKADDAYLCGLFYNFSYVTYEKLIYLQALEHSGFDQCRDDCVSWTARAMIDLGFDDSITSFIADSSKDLFSTSFPFGQALARIGNGLLINAEESASTSLCRGATIDRDLLDATGLTTREIVNVLKDLTRNYKGGLNHH
jgi:hypothetical protein